MAVIAEVLVAEIEMAPSLVSVPPLAYAVTEVRITLAASAPAPLTPTPTSPPPTASEAAAAMALMRASSVAEIAMPVAVVAVTRASVT